MKDIFYHVHYKRTENAPLVQVGYLRLNRKTMTWHWYPHWTWQPEELRNERDFKSRKELINFIHRIGYKDVKLYKD